VFSNACFMEKVLLPALVIALHSKEWGAGQPAPPADKVWECIVRMPAVGLPEEF